MTSSHLQQVESVLHRTVQSLLTRGLNDPRVRGLISITRVAVSPDLAQATVFVSVLPAEQGRTTLRGLISATPYIQSQAGKQVRARRMPKLSFQLDESLKHQANVHAAIQQGVERSGLITEPDDVDPDTLDAQSHSTTEDPES